MITLTEDQFKEMIETAHRAGQHNQGHCDPSAYEAMVYYEREVKKLIIPDVSNNEVALVCETCKYLGFPNNGYPCNVCYEDYNMYEQTNDC